MTTVAVRDGVMACDSRLTGGFISSAPGKVVVGRDCIVGFCGPYASGYTGALWLAGELNDRPETDSGDDNEFIVLRRDGIWLADHILRMAPIKGKFWATGSGGMAAMAAMHMGASALDAVKIAIKLDEGSGPPAMEYQFDS